jgi:hypothetical protein
MVDIRHYPQLRMITWHLPDTIFIEEQDAFAIYERNWRFIDEPSLTETEKQLIQHLTDEYGQGLLNV